ncbi:hypothetical protein E2C01_005320 [Portunus trituberculatus]|uniref:Uncharacterized protein n=1 Tax=Portunus trituberculatus TaxID=210409 RepID=A0A5B7CS83_PORTR|nr:hypothetical protein [Portunus trituberculatus]
MNFAFFCVTPCGVRQGRALRPCLQSLASPHSTFHHHQQHRHQITTSLTPSPLHESRLSCGGKEVEVECVNEGEIRFKLPVCCLHVVVVADEEGCYGRVAKAYCACAEMTHRA